MTPLVEAMKEARKYISSLDRSILGRFAVSEELLIHDDALVRIDDMISADFDTIVPGLHRALDNTRTEMNAMMSTASESFAQVHGELWFWRKRFPKGIDTEGAVEWITKYNAIANSGKKAHDYFAVGIWDVDFVASCIERDIDTELALVTYKAGVK